MSCNNIITFESLITIPKGIEFVLPTSKAEFIVVANTDELNTSVIYGKYPAGKLDTICQNQSITADVNLYEIRVSGYLTYSLAIQCLKSSSNVVPNELGFISANGILPMETIVPNSNNLPYLITEYKAINNSVINLSVSIKDIFIEQFMSINGNDVLVVKGAFEIETN